MGKIQKEGRWVPHELSEENKNPRYDTTHTLLSKFRKNDFLHKIITGDEKWILYDNLKRRKSWVDLRHRRRSPICMPKRFCCVSGGIGQMYCITSYYTG